MDIQNLYSNLIMPNIGRLNNNNEFYVYRLVDPRNGLTFYVGKGKNDRVLSHLKTGKIQDVDLNKDESDFLNDNINENKKLDIEDLSKTSIINSIHKSNNKVIIIIHRHGLSEKEALEVEGALIDAYDPFTNIQNGYHNNGFGVMCIDDYIQLYHIDEALIPSNKFVIIKINNRINCVSDNDYFDAGKGNWSLDPNRVKTAEYILIVENGIIKLVYDNLNLPWNISNGNFKIKKHFISAPFDPNRVITNIPNLYNHRLPAIYRKRGASNPIMYVNC